MRHQPRHKLHLGCGEPLSGTTRRFVAPLKRPPKRPRVEPQPRPNGRGRSGP